MKLIDTHCHLDMKQYDQDREDVINRAQEQGIGIMITIGIDVDSSTKALAIARSHDNIYASVGIHPHDADSCTFEAISKLAGLAADPKVIAIGETGLDFYKDYAAHNVQEESFKMQIRLAKDCGLPVIIHDRDADDDTIKVLEEEGAPERGGVFHCFSGGRLLAEKVLGMGFYISIPGTITFKNAKKLHKTVKYIPTERLLIETDAPFLTPAPHRGKRNEPAYVAYTLIKLAELKSMEVEALAEITSQNAMNLFKIPIVKSDS